MDTLDVNKCLIVGTVSDEPRYNAFGSTGVLNVRVETSSPYTDRDGNRKDGRQWHSVSVWGKRGEALRNLTAGDRIAVQGELRSRSYEHDGQKKWKTEINASFVELLEASSTPAADTSPGAVHHDDLADDDLPF